MNFFLIIIFYNVSQVGFLQYTNLRENEDTVEIEKEFTVDGGECKYFRNIIKFLSRFNYNCDLYQYK